MSQRHSSQEQDPFTLEHEGASMWEERLKLTQMGETRTTVSQVGRSLVSQWYYMQICLSDRLCVHVFLTVEGGLTLFYSELS